MSIEETDEIYRELIRVGRDGAIIVHWNNLVPRRHPRELDGLIHEDKEKAFMAASRDRAFVYSEFIIETIRKSNSHEETDFF